MEAKSGVRSNPLEPPLPTGLLSPKQIVPSDIIKLNSDAKDINKE